MAIRRLNYTGRKRIRHEDTLFIIQDSNNGTAKFTASLNFENYDLPSEALVSVEAYRQTSRMRFEYGSVGNIQPPKNKMLSEFDSPEGILFRVKITSLQDKKGLLLAEANKIRPRLVEEEEDRRNYLLPVKSDDNMGEEVFRIDFEDRPLLLVNAKVGDWRNLATGPMFVSLIYPSAIREILMRVLHVEKYFDVEDEDDWKSQWLRFATLLPGAPDVPKEGEEDRIIDDWVDEVVSSFCRKFRIMEQFGKSWTGEELS